MSLDSNCDSKMCSLPAGAIPNKRTRMLKRAKIVKDRVGVNAAVPFNATYVPKVASEARGVTPSCKHKHSQIDLRKCHFVINFI